MHQESSMNLLKNSIEGYEITSAKIACINFGIFKKNILEKILKHKVKSIKESQINDYDIVFIWGYLNINLNKVSSKVIFVEDGFIRSVGLGGHLSKPISWVFDNKGIYFNSNEESKLENIFLNITLNASQIDKARKIKELIIKNSLSKYNLNKKEISNNLDYHKKNILVIGQVDDDMSIRYGAHNIKNNLDLLARVRSDYKNNIIIYKPHPDIEAGLRKNVFSKRQILNYADHILYESSIEYAFNLSEKVIVNTSLAGFEALIRNKHVVCYGEPFYSGWGLTKDKYLTSSGNRRTKKLNIDELIYGALVEYPIYFDYESYQEIEIEEALNNLINMKPKQTWITGLIQFLQKIKNFFR